MPKHRKTVAALAAVTGLLLLPPFGLAQTPAELNTMQQFLGIMESYFGIIDSTHDISSSAEKSAIFQMQKIQEVYEERGEKARAIDVFKEVLQNTDNPTIRNAAYMMLGDALKETGRADEAVQLLRQGLKENLDNADN